MHKNDFFFEKKNHLNFIQNITKMCTHNKIVGLFKRWWRMLLKLVYIYIYIEFKLVLKIVVTCIVLHNIYIIHDQKKNLIMNAYEVWTNYPLLFM